MNATAASVSGGPQVSLPTRFGTFTAQAWIDSATGAEHLSLSAPGEWPEGDTAVAKPRAAVVPLVRLHSECLTGDVFGSYRCDCGEQLDYALEHIHRRGGTLVYLRGHEGRGIGLANKIRAYSLQESGADTVEANEQLGLPVDARDYAAAAGILQALGLTRIALLSNNPLKQADLSRHGIEVLEVVPTKIAARAENLRYLKTKRDRMHHALTISTPSKTPTNTSPEGLSS
ncbi:riboflavin biosynthesis protein RibBA [Arthrobacter sp. PAMC 25486]|uniref:GTP cyclohydrolase II n=1 Tax=Arthrobacter sp. PAMC 25486 TaxID=1494608 RepID=UPI0005360260|nr:GTP cyclohydrolase II [Arthrobacter sp. PAMC 25486]AIX99884.1 riboflavin biosynthesis protein RibBA [Arthrobacter sp. PAMC 25486]